MTLVELSDAHARDLSFANPKAGLHIHGFAHCAQANTEVWCQLPHSGRFAAIAGRYLDACHYSAAFLTATGMALETTMPVTGSWPMSTDTRRLVGEPMSRTFSSVSERPPHE